MIGTVKIVPVVMVAVVAAHIAMVVVVIILSAILQSLLLSILHALIRGDRRGRRRPGVRERAVGEAAAQPGHFGLLGMRERIGLLGGVCKIASTPGGGTTVRITVPRDRLS